MDDMRAFGNSYDQARPKTKGELLTENTANLNTSKHITKYIYIV